MGFFSGIIKAAGGIARGFLGIPAAAATVTRAVPAAARIVTRAAPIAAAGAVFGAADIATQSLLGGGAAPTPLAAAGGGNGRFRTATLVRTVDVTTGQTVSERILSGSPFLMNKDLAIAKRVLRTANKLGRKFSRKTREKSKRAVLLDAIEDKAISNALGVTCKD
jgi:hypothetical protein